MSNFWKLILYGHHLCLKYANLYKLYNVTISSNPWSHVLCRYHSSTTHWQPSTTLQNIINHQ